MIAKSARRPNWRHPKRRDGYRRIVGNRSITAERGAGSRVAALKAMW